MTKSQTFETHGAIAQFFLFMAVTRDAKEETAKFSYVKCPKSFKFWVWDFFFGVFEKNLSSECAKTWAEATVGRLPSLPPVSSSLNAYENTVKANMQ